MTVTEVVVVRISKHDRGREENESKSDGNEEDEE